MPLSCEFGSFETILKTYLNSVTLWTLSLEFGIFQMALCWPCVMFGPALILKRFSITFALRLSIEIDTKQTTVLPNQSYIASCIYRGPKFKAS